MTGSPAGPAMTQVWCVAPLVTLGENQKLQAALVMLPAPQGSLARGRPQAAVWSAGVLLLLLLLIVGCLNVPAT